MPSAFEKLAAIPVPASVLGDDHGWTHIRSALLVSGAEALDFERALACWCVEHRLAVEVPRRQITPRADADPEMLLAIALHHERVELRPEWPREFARENRIHWASGYRSPLEPRAPVEALAVWRSEHEPPAFELHRESLSEYLERAEAYARRELEIAQSRGWVEVRKLADPEDMRLLARWRVGREPLVDESKRKSLQRIVDELDLPKLPPFGHLGTP